MSGLTDSMVAALTPGDVVHRLASSGAACLAITITAVRGPDDKVRRHRAYGIGPSGAVVYVVDFAGPYHLPALHKAVVVRKPRRVAT